MAGILSLMMPLMQMHQSNGNVSETRQNPLQVAITRNPTAHEKT